MMMMVVVVVVVVMMMVVVMVMVVVVVVKLMERSPANFSVRLEIFKSFSFENRKVRDICYTKPKGKMGVYRRNDGRQELLSCIRSGIVHRQPGKMPNSGLNMFWLSLL